MKSYKLQDIAVVILNWNGKDLLDSFLPSILKYSGNARVYVIDNGSNDDSVALLEDRFSDVVVVKLDDNHGYAGGYNEGLRHIPESIICCLNSDVEVSPNWLDPILDSFNTDDSVAIVQPKLLDYYKKDFFEYAGAAGGFIDKYGYPYCRGRIFNSIEKDSGQYNDTRSIFWASGACFFILKNKLDELGGFDEVFFAHMEEIDLCWRAFNAGYQVIYNGNSTVFHVGGSTLSNINPKKTYLNFRNSLYCLLKNSPSPYFLIFSRLVLDGVAGVRFLSKLQFQHFVAIIHAHFSFYSHFISMVRKRREQPRKRKNYYHSNSIVWRYFIKNQRKF